MGIKTTTLQNNFGWHDIAVQSINRNEQIAEVIISNINKNI